MVRDGEQKAPLALPTALRRRVYRYALVRMLCQRCGRPLEYHRDGFECRAWAWWLREPGLIRPARF